MSTPHSCKQANGAALLSLETSLGLLSVTRSKLIFQSMSRAAFFLIIVSTTICLFASALVTVTFAKSRSYRQMAADDGSIEQIIDDSEDLPEKQDRKQRASKAAA
jgi:hypothetical protein